jgi:hypothetical protein
MSQISQRAEISKKGGSVFSPVKSLNGNDDDHQPEDDQKNQVEQSRIISYAQD